MTIYTILALAIRIILSFSLAKGIVVWKGNSPVLRINGARATLNLAIAASLFAGLYTNVSTLALLIVIGIRFWQNWKCKVKQNKKDYLLLILTLILFLKGPGGISLDRLFGII